MKYLLIILIIFVGCVKEARHSRNMNQDIDKKSVLIKDLALEVEDCTDAFNDCVDSIFARDREINSLKDRLKEVIWERDSLKNEITKSFSIELKSPLKTVKKLTQEEMNWQRKKEILFLE